MRRPCVAINAAVLATTIWIHAGLKANVGTVVARNDRFRAIAEKLRRSPRPHRVARVGIDNSDRSRERGIDISKIDMQFFETIGRTPGGAASMGRRVTLRLLLDHRPIFQFRRACHMIGSYEHIILSRSFLLNFLL